MNVTKISDNLLPVAAAHIIVMSVIFPTINLAEAATPNVWAAYERRVVSTCVKASNLRNARPAGEIINFDDRAGFSALVIDGRYPQAHMKNQRSRVLCLFNKRTRKAFISEADSIVEKLRP